MLNKQKSRNLNSWKYATIVPMLAAFIFLFQVKVVAQEKTVTTTNEKTKLAIEITKDAKDSELEEQKDFFKKDFDADIIFSDVTRNASNEITGIKVTVKDKNQSKLYQVLNNKPIVTFKIAVEKGNNSDENYITFEGTNMRMASENNAIGSALPHPLKPKMPVNVATDAVAINTDTNDDENQKGTFVNTSYKGAVVYINGVKQKESDIVNIPGGQETATINILSPKEAKNKYGKEAKNGAVEIITQKRTTSSANKQSGNFSYAFNEDFVMPNVDQIMAYAEIGVENGMKAIEGIDWDNVNNILQEMSEEDKAALREDMKQMKIDVNIAMKEAHKEMKEAKKEMQKAKKEMEKSKKEMGKKSK